MSDENSGLDAKSVDTSSDDWADESDSSDSDLFDDVKEARKATTEKQAVEAKEKPKAEAKDVPPKPAKRFIKTNVNGREESIDEETLIREYQKAKAGDERLAKASALEKQMQHFVTQLRENPAAILSDPRLGVDRQALAEAILREQIEAELEDPKDREAKTLKERLKAYEDKEAQAKQAQKNQAEQAERQEAVAKAQARLQDTFAKAMEHSVLSKDPETAAATLRDMALYFRMARQQGHDVSPEELAAHVEQKHLKSMHSAANTLTGEELVSFLGEAVVKKIRQADLARLETKAAKPITQTDSTWIARNEKPKEAQFIDPRDLRDQIRSRF